MALAAQGLRAVGEVGREADLQVAVCALDADANVDTHAIQVTGGDVRG